ncbi:hypothetical protein [Polaromonas sp. P5_D5]
MKKLSILLLALAGMAALSGCVAYPVAYDNGPQYRVVPAPAPGYGPGYGRGDRDGDGVRNRYDRRPNDPSRY